MENRDEIFNWLLGLRIRPLGLAVLVAVLSEMRKTGQGVGFFNLSELAARSGVSRRFVRKHMDLLVADGIITVHHEERKGTAYKLRIAPSYAFKRFAPPLRSKRGALPDTGNCA